MHRDSPPSSDRSSEYFRPAAGPPRGNQSALRTRKVIIDADGCPRGAREVVFRLQREFGYQVLTVSSFHHEIESPNHHTVGDAPDEADFAVANRVVRGDVVVTQDLGLAAMVLTKGGLPVSPDGRVITPEWLPMLLEERYLNRKHRRGGGRTKGPRARQPEDDSRFEAALRGVLAESRAGGPSPE